MSRSSQLQAVEWNPEGSWAEVSSTFNYRAAVIGPVDVSGLSHPRVPLGRAVQYRNAYGDSVPGVQGGSFTLRLYLTGHGVSTAGALTAPSDLARLLGYVIGNAGVSAAAGTTVSGGASTPASLDTTAADGFAAGSIAFVGVKGDGGGDGQAAVVAAHAANVLSLLTALPAAPANGAVVYSAEMIYPTESPTAAAELTGLRFRFRSANRGYTCHGCFATQITLETAIGGLPVIAITFGVSRWADSDQALPSAIAMQEYAPANIAGGSFFLREVGTADRETVAVRQATITHTLGVVAVTAPGGVTEHQSIVGAHRTPDEVMLELVVDAGDAASSPADVAAWLANTKLHALWTLSGAASGRRAAIYLPRLCQADERPTQRDVDNLNRVRRAYRADVGPNLTNDLTASAIRYALG